MCLPENTPIKVLNFPNAVFPLTINDFLFPTLFLWESEFNSRRKFLNDFCCQQNDKPVKFSITESTYRIMCVCIRVCKCYLGSSQNPSPNT